MRLAISVSMKVEKSGVMAVLLSRADKETSEPRAESFLKDHRDTERLLDTSRVEFCEFSCDRGMPRGRCKSEN